MPCTPYSALVFRLKNWRWSSIYRTSNICTPSAPQPPAVATLDNLSNIFMETWCRALYSNTSVHLKNIYCKFIYVWDHMCDTRMPTHTHTSYRCFWPWYLTDSYTTFVRELQNKLFTRLLIDWLTWKSSAIEHTQHQHDCETSRCACDDRLGLDAIKTSVYTFLSGLDWRFFVQKGSEHE